MAKKSDRPRKAMPTAAELADLLVYDQLSGELTWKWRPRAMFQTERIFRSWNAKKAYRPAFTMLGANGYLYGSLWGRRFLAHRIIFKMMVGRDPDQIDHINGARLDNRWANLRETDQGENTRNSAKPRTNTSGRVGVYWHKDRRQWVASIKVRRRSINLGYFREFDQAASARAEAEKKYGFHANHGREAIHG